MSMLRSATYKGVNLKLHTCGKIYYITRQEGKLSQRLSLACESRARALDLFRMQVINLM